MKMIFNGDLIDSMELQPGDWLPGKGVFETIRAEERQTFALHRHYCRAKDAAVFNLPNEEVVTSAVNRLLTSKNYPISRLRISFRNDGDWLITNHEYLDPKPAKLMIFNQPNMDNELRIKSFPYDRNLALHQDANAAGFDDGILLTTDGEVAETAFANIALEIDGEWLTPPLTAGILNGVMRAIAIDAKMISVAPITKAQLERASRGLLISSLRIAQEIAEIDGRKLASAQTKSAQIWKLIESFRGF